MPLCLVIGRWGAGVMGCWGAGDGESAGVLGCWGARDGVSTGVLGCMACTFHASVIAQTFAPSPRPSQILSLRSLDALEGRKNFFFKYYPFVSSCSRNKLLLILKFYHVGTRQP